MVRLTLRPEEVAQMLGVSKTLVYSWIRDGYLPAIHTGKRGATILIPKVELDAWVASNTRRVR